MADEDMERDADALLAELRAAREQAAKADAARRAAPPPGPPPVRAEVFHDPHTEYKVPLTSWTALYNQLLESQSSAKKAEYEKGSATAAAAAAGKKELFDLYSTVLETQQSKEAEIRELHAAANQKILEGATGTVAAQTAASKELKKQLDEQQREHVMLQTKLRDSYAKVLNTLAQFMPDEAIKHVIDEDGDSHMLSKDQRKELEERKKQIAEFNVANGLIKLRDMLATITNRINSFGQPAASHKPVTTEDVRNLRRKIESLRNTMVRDRDAFSAR